MHPSTAVDPYLALNCAQHLAALLHGGIFFRKVSWISTKCVASSVKVCSGKLWPKKCQIWHRLSGDQVSKRVAEVSKRLHINVLYKTQSNTIPFCILHWIVYNWHKCQIEGSLRHLRCCIPQILLHCAQCYSQKANVVRASKYRTKYHHHRHHGSRYLSSLRWPSHFLLVKSFSLQNLCC